MSILKQRAPSQTPCLSTPLWLGPRLLPSAVKLLLCTAACRVLCSPPLRHNRMGFTVTNISASPGWREVMFLGKRVTKPIIGSVPHLEDVVVDTRPSLTLTPLRWWVCFDILSPGEAFELHRPIFPSSRLHHLVVKSLVFTHAERSCDAPNFRVDQRFAGWT